jgi:cytochrome P450
MPDRDADQSPAPNFPFERAHPFDPPLKYAEARRSCPVMPVTLWNGKRSWIVTRLEHYRAVLLDRRFSGEFAHPDFPAITAARVVVDKQERAFVGMDDPRHQHYRRMFVKEFTAKRLERLRPKIREIATGLLDDMTARRPPLDLIECFATPLPALVMCELFGTPYSDHTYIMRLAAGRHGLKQSPEEAGRAARELVAYCRRLIEAKRNARSDDLLGRVIEEYVSAGALSESELADICAMILRAGHDTTANMIGLGTLALLEHPGELEKLRRRPELLRNAIEELLRYLSPVQFVPRRVALEDVEIGGERIRRGDGVFPLSSSANRDETVFPNPDGLDVERDASRHVAFGYGTHQCLGQALARLEMEVAFEQLFARLPGLRCALPISELAFKHDMQIHGVYRLPVTW